MAPEETFRRCSSNQLFVKFEESMRLVSLKYQNLVRLRTRI